MGNLSGIVFGKNGTEVLEVMGHKVEVKKLTTKDMIEGKIDLSIFAEDKPNMSELMANVVRALAFAIISIDGIKPDNHEATAEFLLNQEQSVVLTIFKKSDIFGTNVVEEEIKN
jgi:hypothetical protein